MQRIGVVFAVTMGLIGQGQAQKLYLDAQAGMGSLEFSILSGGLRYEQNSDWGIRVYGGVVQKVFGGFEGQGFGMDAYKLLYSSQNGDTYVGGGMASASGSGYVSGAGCFLCSNTRDPATAWMAYGLFGMRVAICRFEFAPYVRSVSVQGVSESGLGISSSFGLTIPISP